MIVDHKALPIANTIGDARGGFYFAICQVCQRSIYLDRNKPTGLNPDNRESWKHE